MAAKRVHEIPLDGSHRKDREIKEIMIGFNFRKLFFTLE
jgi:hypothetical protein